MKILAPIATTVIVVAGGIIIVVEKFGISNDNNLVQEYQINRIDWLQPLKTQSVLAQSIKAGSGQLVVKALGFTSYRTGS